MFFFIEMSSLKGVLLHCTYIFFAVKPLIVLYPNTSEFLAGSMLLLSCVGYGVPPPHVVWSKDGLDLRTAAINDSRISTWDDIVTMDRNIFTPFTQSYLRICSTVKTDSGLYKCSAVTDEEETAVEFRVTVVEVPPALLRFPSNAILQLMKKVLSVLFPNFSGCRYSCRNGTECSGQLYCIW